MALIVFLIAYLLLYFLAGILVAPQGVQQWLEEFSWWQMVGADVRVFLTANWAIPVAVLFAFLAYRYVLEEPSQYLEERLFPLEVTEATKGLLSPDLEKRQNAVNNLADQKAYDELKRALRNRYPDVRTEVALILAEHGGHCPIRQLIEIVRSKHRYVTEEHCKRAIAALGECKAHNAGAVLAETLNDSRRNEQARKAAAYAMGKIKSTKTTKNALTQALKDENDKVAISAAEALGQMRDITVIDALGKRLVKYSDSIYEPAIPSASDRYYLEPLEQVADASAEALVHIINGQKEPSRLQWLIDKFLRQRSNYLARALWYLVELLHSTKKNKYGGLISTISGPAREMALRELSLALGNEKRREMAVEALVFLQFGNVGGDAVDPFKDPERAMKFAYSEASPILREALNDPKIKNDAIKVLNFIDTVNIPEN